MAYTAKQAARAFRHIMAPINAAQDEARHLDAGFDAGEFSGPAHDRIEACIEAQVIDRICARMGVQHGDVLDAMYEAIGVEGDHFMDSLR